MKFSIRLSDGTWFTGFVGTTKVGQSEVLLRIMDKDEVSVALEDLQKVGIRGEVWEVGLRPT